MKYILILSLILFSCASQKGFVSQDARMEIKGNRVKIKFFGPTESVRDTVMVVTMIRKK